MKFIVDAVPTSVPADWIPILGLVFGTSQVLSPLKNVVESVVPEEPKRAVGTVPEPRLEAFNAVNDAPEPLKTVADTVPVEGL